MIHCVLQACHIVLRQRCFMLELYVNDGNPNPESNQPTNHATSFILVLSSVYHFYCIQYFSLSLSFNIYLYRGPPMMQMLKDYDHLAGLCVMKSHHKRLLPRGSDSSFNSQLHSFYLLTVLSTLCFTIFVSLSNHY